MAREIESNKAHLMGKILGAFTFSHENHGERFYTASLEVNRLSEQKDVIPLIVSDRIVNVSNDCNGRTVKVVGRISSFNKHEGNINRLLLDVFCQEFEFIEEFKDYTKTNNIFLDGYICKEPIYRRTPLGREIASILLAVNRPYGKSDYIPCIAWGRNAVFASQLKVGDHLQVEGRIQSREYQKHISETETETHTAIEVSLSKMELAQ